MFTPEEKYAELLRELELRRVRYPVWIAEGKLDEETARARIAVLEEIVADFGQHHDRDYQRNGK